MTNASALLQKDKLQPKELPYLSPSSINLYLQDPALWVLKHFYGSTSGFNVYAMRGVAIEDGVNKHIEEGVSVEEAMAYALDQFVEKSFGWGDDDLVDSLEACIPEWTRLAIEATLACAEGLPQTQNKIDHIVFDIPVTGYLDYSWPEIQVDLKTCNKLPKIVSRGDRKGFLEASKKANVRQQAIYKDATGKTTALLFVTPEESLLHILSDEELKEGMDVNEIAIKEIKELLTLDIGDIIERTVPKWKTMNYSFYWDAELRDLASDIWWEYEDEEEDDEI